MVKWIGVIVFKRTVMPYTMSGSYIAGDHDRAILLVVNSGLASYLRCAAREEH